MLFRYFYWLLLGACVLSFYVWQQTQAVRLGYRVDAVRTECDRWKQENESWRLKKSCLISLEKLDKAARASNLKTPDEKHIFYLP